MRKTSGIILLLCLMMAAITACGTGKALEPPDEKISQYVEFRPVTGYYEGQKYTADLPYLIGEEDNAVVRTENSNVEKFAEKIRNSTKDQGYKVDVSCVLTNDSLVSIRLAGNDDIVYGRDGDLWATNYNVLDCTSSSIATLQFPNSENYEAWLQRYVNQRDEKENNGKTRVYNFRVPYLYYTGDSVLTAAVMFAMLNDGGETWETIEEIDITQGPAAYFTAGEMDAVSKMFIEPDGMPSMDSASDLVNDEYAIAVTWPDSKTGNYVYRLFALGQINPIFPDLFDSLKLKVTFEPGLTNTGDYIKVYTFSDAMGHKNFVLKTQYWGEKDWQTGFERVSYVGADFIDGATTGTIRGLLGMTEEELLSLYPQDLSVTANMKPDQHAALNMTKPTKAYIYKDPNDNSGRDLVFIVKNGLVISMDTSENYEYSRYDKALGLSKPLSGKNHKASDLVVTTASSYNKTFDVLEVLPGYPYADQFSGDERTISIDIKVPQIAETVPGAAAINKMITANHANLISTAERLNKGDLSVLSEGDLIGHLSMDYQVYRFNHATALVIESKGYIFHGGGGNVCLIVYYDCDTGNRMTPREYLKKCGITEKSILEKCAAENYVPSVPGDQIVKTIYDVKFAVDDSGKVMLYTEMGD